MAMRSWSRSGSGSGGRGGNRRSVRVAGKRLAGRVRKLRVRMGVHTGSPRVRDEDYWGVDVHYAARLCAAASGGQVLL